MTYEEALKLDRELLKDIIRDRLHKRNPTKYKASQKLWSLSEIWEIKSTLAGDFFTRDDVFYKYLMKKK